METFSQEISLLTENECIQKINHNFNVNHVIILGLNIRYKKFFLWVYVFLHNRLSCIV